MKKLFLLLTLFSFTFLHAKIDEYKSDVYFANGIDTTEKQAKDAKNALKIYTKKLYPEAYKQIKNWKVSYNETNGFQQDIYESAIQKIFTKLDDTHSGYAYAGATAWIVDKIMGIPGAKDLIKGAIYYGGRELVKEQLKELLIEETKKALLKRGLKLSKEDILFLADELFDELLDKLLVNPLDDALDDINQDVLKQATAYAHSINEGHGVIVVAHSQGNFFTNFTVEKKMQPWTYRYFNVIGVATPASSVANGGNHITFDNDVIQAVPGHLGWNVKNPKRYYFTNAVNEEIETFLSVEAHNFLNSYMETNETRNTILSFIDSSVKKHKKADSQWVVDQELNKGTKDYRITVKHRLQSDMNPIMKDVEVYPFNTDKKLYYVDGNISGYVKASCGGTKILDADKDTWDNQQDNEVYYLEGTREVIVGEAFDFLLTVTDRNVYYFPIDYKSGDEIVIASFVKGRYNYCDSIYYRDAFEKFKDVNMVKASEYFKDTNWHGGNFLLPADLFLHRVESKLRYGGMNSKKVSTFKELKEFLLHTMSLESSDFTPTGCYPQKLYVQKY